MTKFQVAVNMEHETLPAEITAYVTFEAEDLKDAGLNFWHKPEYEAVTKNLNDAGWHVNNNDAVDIDPVED